MMLMLDTLPYEGRRSTSQSATLSRSSHRQTHHTHNGDDQRVVNTLLSPPSLPPRSNEQTHEDVLSWICEEFRLVDQGATEKLDYEAFYQLARVSALARDNRDVTSS
jgi:hypothetical protein